MPGQPDSQTTSAVTSRVPNDQKEALIYLADAESTPHERVSVSQLVREFISDGLRDRWDDLPEEAKDVLDEDLKANAGGESA